MSKEIYDTSMELIQNILSEDRYKELTIDLEKKFINTHISITQIDKEEEELLGYYYEKTLVTPIKGEKDILDIIYSDNRISLSTYNFLKNKTLSIFIVNKIKKDYFIILDIFNKNKKIKIPLTESWFALEKGDLIQGFLYNSEELYFSTYCFIHPRGVNKFILKQSKSIIKNKNYDYIDKFLAQLFRKFVNSMRYSGKEPIEIYNLNL